MKQLVQEMWWKILLVLVVFIAVGYFAGVSRTNTSNVSPESALTTVEPDARILLLPSGPVPASLDVLVGSVLEIASRDGSSHDLISSHEGMSSDAHATMHTYASGVFGADEAYRVRFDTPGTFTFTDRISSKIVIHITVNERSK